MAVMSPDMGLTYGTTQQRQAAVFNVADDVQINAMAHDVRGLLVVKCRC